MTASPSTTQACCDLTDRGWRSCVLLWLLGLPGASALAWGMLPEWLADLGLVGVPVDFSLLCMGGLAVVLAMCVALGCRLGPGLGLRAPVLTAWASGRPVRHLMAQQVLPGMAGGILGAVLLISLALIWPESLPLIDPVYAMPLSVKLLYGGITMELVTRLGGLTLVMWLLWRLAGSPEQAPDWRLGAAAVLLCALLWGAAELALALALAGDWPMHMGWPLLLCETIYGALAGFLFWRHGLESAIFAHLITYLLSHGLG
ncbi:hypothetical protein [Comamonas composti]|uniref:hypothetical protein n=1 Tax=Comamonas composti TaxID=408558 RepID=UPI000423FAFE|nr:hypothetical protein [Comamonas composti]